MPDRLTPRVVFFGPPNAGKSSLLRAFARVVGGSVPADAHPSARSPVHPFPLPGPLEVCDCDGRAAGELLSRPAARGRLGDAIRSADALVLVIDAAADEATVDATFRAFQNFLSGLETGRAFGREVGGLPVFLTLTKCDALARPADEPTQWLNRVEDRKRELETRFEASFADALADPDPASYFPFGSVDLYVMATAVRTPARPAFDPYADPDGSFGVADLAGELVPAARAYRVRQLRAGQRLKVTVGGVGAAVGVMLAGLVGLAAAGVGGDPLADRVRFLRDTEGPPAARLADKTITRFRADLTDVRERPGFARLPTDLRTYVEDRLKEIDAYRTYRAKFQPPRLSPAEVRTREELAQLESALAGELAPPPDYAAAWSEPPTDAVRLRTKWQADVTLLGEAEGRVNDWYRGLIRRANQLLLTEEPPDGAWRDKVTAAVAEEDKPPFKSSDPIPGSPAVPVKRGAALTYAPAFEFDRIDQARRDWVDARDHLLALRALADALGLTPPGPGTPPAVLALPEPGAGVDSLNLATARLRALADAFPDKPLKHPEWEADGFPDPARRWLDPRLAGAFGTGVRHVRQLVRDRLGPDRPENWRKLADTFLNEPPVKDWGRLLGLLRRWADSTTAADPVAEFADFLKRDRFDLSPKRLNVAIPDDLLGDRLIPTGKLVLRHTPAAGEPMELAYRQIGDGLRERPLTTYRFVPDGPPGVLVYRPGDGFTATLPLRAGGDEYRLVWSASRSGAYQWDALMRPPVLEKAGPVSAPEPAPGVAVAAPDGGLPVVPVLLPAVK